jgi:hypothetical protein
MVGIFTRDLAKAGLLRTMGFLSADCRRFDWSIHDNLHRNVQSLQDAGEWLKDTIEKATAEQKVTALDLLSVVFLLALEVVVLRLALSDVSLDGRFTLGTDGVEVLGFLLRKLARLGELSVWAWRSQDGCSE